MAEMLPFVKGSSSRPPDYSDIGNAQRFAMQHGKGVRYCAELSHASCRGWFIQDESGSWCQDVTGEVMRRAKRTVESITTEHESYACVDIDKQLAHHATSQCKDRIVAMLELAQSELPIACTVRDLNLPTCEPGGKTRGVHLV